MTLVGSISDLLPASSGSLTTTKNVISNLEFYKIIGTDIFVRPTYKSKCCTIEDLNITRRTITGYFSNSSFENTDFSIGPIRREEMKMKNLSDHLLCFSFYMWWKLNLYFKQPFRLFHGSIRPFNPRTRRSSLWKRRPLCQIDNGGAHPAIVLVLAVPPWSKKIRLRRSSYLQHWSRRWELKRKLYQKLTKDLKYTCHSALLKDLPFSIFTIFCRWPSDCSC